MIPRWTVFTPCISPALLLAAVGLLACPLALVSSAKTQPAVRGTATAAESTQASSAPSEERAEVQKVLENIEPLVALLGEVDDVTLQRDVLRGLREGLRGRRQLPRVAGWDKAAARLLKSTDAEVRQSAQWLAVVFGDEATLATLRRVVLDGRAPASERQPALETLLHRQDRSLLPLLQQLVTDATLRSTAIRGLAAFDDPATPAWLLKHYPHFTADEKQDVIHTLTSRPHYATALLDAVAAQQVPRQDLTTFTVRQLANSRDAAIRERIGKIWGELRPPAADKARLVAQYKSLLTPEYLKMADLSRGRQIFQRTCANCHVLFDAGNRIGPEITGSQRANLDYILENLLDPSAQVPRDYQITIVELKSGRVIAGMVKQETDFALTLQTTNELVTVAKPEIEERVKSPLSMMPDGQLKDLTDAEVRDLIAYLASPQQVPLPKPAR